MDHVVAAALLRGADEVLLCHRTPHRLHYPDVWDFAGGHIEPGETPLAALGREVREELGIALDVTGLSPTPDLRVERPDFRLAVWSVWSWQGQPANTAPEEHDSIAWCAIDRAVEMELAHPAYASWLSGLRR